MHKYTCVHFDGDTIGSRARFVRFRESDRLVAAVNRIRWTGEQITCAAVVCLDDKRWLYKYIL